MKSLITMFALLITSASGNAFAGQMAVSSTQNISAAWSCPLANQGIPMGSVIFSQQIGNQGSASPSTPDQGTCPNITPPTGNTCYRILLTHQTGVDVCGIEGWNGPNSAFAGSAQNVICTVQGKHLVPDANPYKADKCVANVKVIASSAYARPSVQNSGGVANAMIAKSVKQVGQVNQRGNMTLGVVPVGVPSGGVMKAGVGTVGVLNVVPKIFNEVKAGEPYGSDCSVPGVGSGKSCFSCATTQNPPLCDGAGANKSGSWICCMGTAKGFPAPSIY